MASESKDARKSTPSDPVVNDRVQELTWALLDEQISTDEVQLLENLLLSDDAARETYLHCVQLHADLFHHFRQPVKGAPTRTGKSLVLGFLNESLPGAGLDAPTS
jgi:hypothetical protein